MKQSDKDLPTAEDVKGIIPLPERTIPTPAQIEAAKKELITIFSPCVQGRMADQTFTIAAELALTAAAQVCTCAGSKAGHDDGCALSATAAQIGEPVDTAERYIKMSWHFEQIAKAKTITIERCAQVAEQHWIPGPFNTIPQDIADAIRKRIRHDHAASWGGS